jgi:SMI1 / KNR4 family (SUKH-1)
MSAADELIDRLRARAADPERRVDVRASQFMAGVSTLDLSGLMGMLGQVSGDLKRVVAANQAGAPVDPALHAKAEAFGAAMSTPVATMLPPPADAAALARAETSLGFALPPFLRRVYLEVADGGFGPGVGLLGIDAAVAAYGRLRDGGELPRGRTWPDQLLPVVERDPGNYCVDAATTDGRVVDWDPEELGEFSGEKAFARSFSEEAPSVEAWLRAWVGGKTQAEQHQEMLQKAMVDAARQSRAYFAAMTPEQRREYGFPDEGWESQIAGGLGMEENEDQPSGG